MSEEGIQNSESISKMRIENREIETVDLFETLMENFPDIIHSVNHEGQIVMTNKKAESLLGYTREELLSMNVREIYADEVLENLNEGFRNLQESGDIAVESLLKDKSGKHIPVEIRSFSIYDDHGKFVRTFSIFRDIRQVKELQGGLIQAERLAAVGEMASGILHDINNPLTVIRGCCDLIRNTIETDVVKKSMPGSAQEEITSYAADIDRASKAIEKLSYHLRQFARGLENENEVFDLYDCISDAIFITGAKIRDHAIRLLADLEKNTFFTYGQKSKVEQIFVNLIGNACDAMADHTTRNLNIVLDACTCEIDDADGGKGNGVQEYCRITVSDTGSGIPEELAEEIFKSFYTTKDPAKGTGLGLAIVRAIITDHGGDISFSSTLGKGTTFKVLLPRNPKPKK